MHFVVVQHKSQSAVVRVEIEVSTEKKMMPFSECGNYREGLEFERGIVAFVWGESSSPVS